MAEPTVNRAQADAFLDRFLKKVEEDKGLMDGLRRFGKEHGNFWTRVGLNLLSDKEALAKVRGKLAENLNDAYQGKAALSTTEFKNLTDKMLAKAEEQLGGEFDPLRKKMIAQLKEEKLAPSLSYAESGMPAPLPTPATPLPGKPKTGPKR